jgi:hypothetical protein
MDDLDIFLELYKQQVNLAEDSKKQLSSISSILVTIAALLFGLITIDKTISVDDLPIACILILIGILGILFSFKNQERYVYHIYQILKYRRAIDSILRWKELQDNKILEMRNEIRKSCEVDDSIYLIESLVRKSFRDYRKHATFFAYTKEYSFWIALHFLISVIGTLITITIIIKNNLI